MSLAIATLISHLALLAAMAYGAFLNDRWMQRQVQEVTVSPDTMLNRVIRLIDTSPLQPDEIALVRSLKERRARGQVVNVTAVEFKMIEQIHGRLYR